MSWTRIGGTNGTGASLAYTSTVGNLVICVVLGHGLASPPLSVSDGTVTLTKTTNSPAVQGTFGSEILFITYVLSTSGGAKTYTATPTGWTVDALFVEEYSYTGGTAAFDVDAKFTTASQATPVTSPSVTPAASGELLFSFVFPSVNSLSAGSPWTTSQHAFSSCGAYILSSASGATAVNFADLGNPDAWASMAAAFTINAAAFSPDEDYWKAPGPQLSDPDITVWQ